MTPDQRQITLNGAPREVSSPTLAALLSELGFGDARVATALNGAFVPAAQRGDTPLGHGDRVEIVSARVGG